MPNSMPTPPPSLPTADASPPKASAMQGSNPNAGLGRSPEDKEEALKVQRLNEYANRIREAIAKIDLVSHTATRAILCGYYQQLNYKLARFGQQNFPKTVRRHASSDERSTEFGKPTLLFFHVGNAILGMYAYALGHADTKGVLESRIKLLEGIAEEGISAFAIVGDDNVGFTLERGS